MPHLQDFISARARQIEEALGPLLEQQAEIERKVRAYESELGELRKAAKAIGLENDEETPSRARRPQPPVTIKQAVLAVLAGQADGLPAADILDKINARFSLDLVRTSLSPQLSRLKRDGRVFNQGNAWLLAEMAAAEPARKSA